MALLGLFHDATNWTAQSPPRLVAQRQWRTGVISPFSANVMLLLYTCSDGPRVKLLHNEGEYAIPACNGEIYCPYATFKTIYAEALAFDWASTCDDATGIPVVSHETVLSSVLTLTTLTAIIFSLLIGFGLGVVFRSLRPPAPPAYAVVPVVEEGNL